MMEPVEVTARFDLQGKAYPLKFTWGGRPCAVASTGRRWTDLEGQHILVLSPDGRVFELLFKPSEARWYLNHAAQWRKIALPT